MAGLVNSALKCLVFGSVIGIALSMTINIDNEDVLKILSTFSSNPKTNQRNAEMNLQQSPLLTIDMLDSRDNNVNPNNEEPTKPIHKKKLSEEKIAGHVKKHFNSLFKGPEHGIPKKAGKVSSRSFDNFLSTDHMDPANIPDYPENQDLQQDKNNENETQIDYEDLKKDPIEYNYVTRKWDDVKAYGESLTAADLESGNPTPSLLRHFGIDNNFESIFNASVDRLANNMERILKEKNYNVDDKVRIAIRNNIRPILKKKLDENKSFLNDNVPSLVKDKFEDEAQKRKEKIDELSLDFHDH